MQVTAARGTLSAIGHDRIEALMRDAGLVAQRYQQSAGYDVSLYVERRDQGYQV